MSQPTRDITKIQVQKKIKDRVNVYVDGVYAFPINAEEVLKRGLKEGVKIADAELEDLLLESELERVLAKIMNFLSYRPRSEKEIKDRLYRYTKEYKEKQSVIIERAMTMLNQKNLVNDEEFTEWYVSNRQVHRPRSRKHLESELYAKGITKEIIKKVLQKTAFNESDEIHKILKKDKSGKTKKEYIEFLLRKGFAYEKICEVIEEISL